MGEALEGRAGGGGVSEVGDDDDVAACPSFGAGRDVQQDKSGSASSKLTWGQPAWSQSTSISRLSFSLMTMLHSDYSTINMIGLLLYRVCDKKDVEVCSWRYLGRIIYLHRYSIVEENHLSIPPTCLRMPCHSATI